MARLGEFVLHKFYAFAHHQRLLTLSSLALGLPLALALALPSDLGLSPLPCLAALTRLVLAAMVLPRGVGGGEFSSLTGGNERKGSDGQQGTYTSPCASMQR